ncbi:PQQ-binding-like beta-propeller repeat protein [Gemmatimonas sp.]|jgi:quinoprotein glucose dehydrogenase|uniref:outer membrane protein assembly factor BamB family protein n=1 Tax=Gemmatimonas sp. TaxID=1962908 RepID=UPI0037C16B33
MIRRLLLALLVATPVAAQNADWPVYHGNDDHTHFSRLSQITPANVKQLKVAWTFDTKDAFPGSEMQANPIVIDGVLYATTPKLQVIALDAVSGRQIWRFDPQNGAPPTSRIRHRGVVVTGDRVLFNYRNRLYALDRRTGQPIRTFGDSGWIDLRQGLGRPVEGLSVSASTPGVVYGDLLIVGSTVPEQLPSAPGDIRAFDINTGQLRWSFHTIPHPGEPGYDTWPADAWKIAGGANAWSGVTLDAKRGMVFAATGSASYDFYGANRLGDNLYANSVIALDAKTGQRLWHYQVLKHDLWDRDLPAAPILVTVQRDGKPVEALAQITKTGHTFLFDRVTGTPLFPIEERRMPQQTLPGDRVSPTQNFPVSPPPFARQQLTRRDLTRRTPAAYRAALKTFNEYNTPHPFTAPTGKGIIIYPGVDGGGEWGGPAFDPGTGLMYVNSNEMAWLLKLVPRSDASLYSANCAGCHGDKRGGTAIGPSLLDIASRRSREQITQMVREGTGRMPGFGAAMDGGAINDIVNYLVTGKDETKAKATAAPNPYALPYRTAYFDIFLDHEGYPGVKTPWGTLNAIDLNKGTIAWSIPFGEYPKLAAKGIRNTGTDSYGGAIVTENGLLIIAATTYDNKIRAYDKLKGTLLWEATLPFAGNATPSTYMVNGKQYIVIACGGGKNGAPSGGVYVAFALP